MTFQEAARLLGNRISKKVAYNTVLQRIDANTIGVKLHKTYVVHIHANGTYTLASGGYRTATTKKRINRFSPACLFQKDFEWYCGSGRRLYTFFDGIRVDSAGNVLNADPALAV